MISSFTPQGGNYTAKAHFSIISRFCIKLCKIISGIFCIMIPHSAAKRKQNKIALTKPLFRKKTKPHNLTKSRRLCRWRLLHSTKECVRAAALKLTAFSDYAALCGTRRVLLFSCVRGVKRGRRFYFIPESSLYFCFVASPPRMWRSCLFMSSITRTSL